MTPLISDDGEPVEDSGTDLPKSDADSDKKVIKWKLSLHQIGLLTQSIVRPYAPFMSLHFCMRLRSNSRIAVC